MRNLSFPQALDDNPCFFLHMRSATRFQVWVDCPGRTWRCVSLLRAIAISLKMASSGRQKVRLTCGDSTVLASRPMIPLIFNGGAIFSLRE